MKNLRPEDIEDVIVGQIIGGYEFGYEPWWGRVLPLPLSAELRRYLAVRYFTPRRERASVVRPPVIAMSRDDLLTGLHLCMQDKPAEVIAAVILAGGMVIDLSYQFIQFLIR